MWSHLVRRGLEGRCHQIFFKNIYFKFQYSFQMWMQISNLRPVFIVYDAFTIEILFDPFTIWMVFKLASQKKPRVLTYEVHWVVIEPVSLQQRISEIIYLMGYCSKNPIHIQIILVCIIVFDIRSEIHSLYPIFYLKII